MLLKNKVAIITGGTRGIGGAIVKKFISEGCRVAFTFAKNRKMAERTVRSSKGRARGYQLDVRRPEDVRELILKVKRDFKKIDILVNNAGTFEDKPLLMMDNEVWNKVIDTNLTGAFNVSRACIFTFMKQKSGNIINVSSLSGVVGIAGQTNYCASKAGLIGFTKALAKEVGPCGIRVNAVAPGFIRTGSTDTKVKNSVRAAILAQTPLKRFGTAEEVAESVLFLATEKASYITGKTLIIDGGLAA